MSLPKHRKTAPRVANFASGRIRRLHAARHLGSQWVCGTGHSATGISVAGREDEQDIELLYAHTVPQMIQLVEPRPPLDGEIKWVLRESGN